MVVDKISGGGQTIWWWTNYLVVDKLYGGGQTKWWWTNYMMIDKLSGGRKTSWLRTNYLLSKLSDGRQCGQYKLMISDHEESCNFGRQQQC